jgi:hypothetical protein
MTGPRAHVSCLAGAGLVAILFGCAPSVAGALVPAVAA